MGTLRHIFNELHYEMPRTIAEGGMGVVYEALQHGSGGFTKVVAGKLIREEYSTNEACHKNFIGEALFRDTDRLVSRQNIPEMPIPKFTELRPEIDSRLQAIIQKPLERDRELRYQSAFEMLHDLEVCLNRGGSGPNNEKLGAYLKPLIAEPVPEPLFTP